MMNKIKNNKNQHFNNRNHYYNNDYKEHYDRNDYYYNRDMRNGGSERNWGGYNTDKNVYDNHYDIYGRNIGGNENSENFHKEWPTPWEGKMLKKLRQILQMEANSWGPAGW